MFYVEDAQEGEGGELCFESGEVITPKAGLLVMFDGQANHWVNKYLGDKPRYSVAVNRI